MIQIRIGESEKYNDSYFYNYICGKGRNNGESDSSSVITINLFILDLLLFELRIEAKVRG